MSARRIARFLGAVVVTTWAVLLSAAVPSASAQPCPDVEVVFARGTAEPPGVGGIGQAICRLAALASLAAGRSGCMRSTTPPAAILARAWSSPEPSSTGLGTRALMSSPWRRTARTPGWCSADIRKARSWRVSSPRLRCRRKYLLRSYRTYPSRCRRRWLTTSPRSSCWESLRRTLCASSARRRSLSARLYAAKTIELCAPGDTICSGAFGGGPTIAHALYGVNGMVNEAAAFAASRL